MTTTHVEVGERLRSLRTAQNLSVRTLAVKAGFSPSFISQIENGQASPSIASLERIAEVLQTTLVGFFDPEVDDSKQIVRFAERQQLNSSWSRAKIEALGPIGGRSRMDAVMITLSPGGRSGKKPHTQSGEEFAVIFEGKITLTLGPEVHDLQRGDAVTLSSETPHLWENKSSEIARVVIVSTRFTH
jgi:XRE family transcriptional regulator, regulator of sulfur utilization